MNLKKSTLFHFNYKLERVNVTQVMMCSLLKRTVSLNDLTKILILLKWMVLCFHNIPSVMDQSVTFISVVIIELAGLWKFSFLQEVLQTRFSNLSFLEYGWWIIFFYKSYLKNLVNSRAPCMLLYYTKEVKCSEFWHFKATKRNLVFQHEIFVIFYSKLRAVSSWLKPASVPTTVEIRRLSRLTSVINNSKNMLFWMVKRLVDPQYQPQMCQKYIRPSKRAYLWSYRLCTVFRYIYGAPLMNSLWLRICLLSHLQLTHLYTLQVHKKNFSIYFDNIRHID